MSESHISKQGQIFRIYPWVPVLVNDGCIYATVVLTTFPVAVARYPITARGSHFEGAAHCGTEGTGAGALRQEAETDEHWGSAHFFLLFDLEPQLMDWHQPHLRSVFLPH